MTTTHSAPLTVRIALPAEAAAFDAQLATHHYLGAGRPVGDYLRQFVERDGVPDDGELVIEFAGAAIRLSCS